MFSKNKNVLLVVGKNCAEQNLGSYEEIKSCNLQACEVNGGYSEWTDWSSCSVNTLF